MMKIFKKKLAVTIVGIIALNILVLGNIAIVNASDTGSGKVYVGKSCQFFAAALNVKRSGKYDNVYVTVESVYPTKGEDDTYTRCRCILTSGSKDISKMTVLKEDAGRKQSVKILNGYLDKKKFTLKFAGNSPKHDAYIIYKYDGR